MKIGKLKSKKIFYTLFAALLAPVALTSCHDNLDVSEDNGGVVENKEGTYVTVSLSGVGQNKPSSPKQIGRPAPTRINYTLDVTPTRPVPKFDMKVGDVIKVAAVFVNSTDPAKTKTIVPLTAKLTSVSDKDFGFVCEKKVKLNIDDINKGTWYYMGIIGGEFDQAAKQVKFKTETNLRPFSRTGKNQKISIESPFTTDWVKMKVAKNEKGENVLRTAAKNKTITYKARGVILVMSMANETQMDVKINRTFTLVTNNLTTNGYYDLDAAGNGFKAEDKSYKLWKTAETPASEYYSAKQNEKLGDSYRTNFTFIPGDDSKPGQPEPEKYMYFNKVQQGGTGEHIKLNRYYLAWLMPKEVGANYSIMLGSAECTESARTKTTSTLPAELWDKKYYGGTGYDRDELPTPDKWKPDMSSIAIGGFAKKMTAAADDGKVFRLNMSLVRPMLPIERLMPNAWDEKTYNTAEELSRTLYRYFRNPNLNDINTISNTPIAIPKELSGVWGKRNHYYYDLQVDGMTQAMHGLGELGITRNNYRKRAYSVQDLILIGDPKDNPPAISSDYTAAYWIEKTSELLPQNRRLVYKVLYLGPHFKANNVTTYLVANPGFWGNDDNINASDNEKVTTPFFGRDTEKMIVTRNIIYADNDCNFWLYSPGAPYITKHEKGPWTYSKKFPSPKVQNSYYILPYLITPSWGPRIRVAQ